MKKIIITFLILFLIVPVISATIISCYSFEGNGNDMFSGYTLESIGGTGPIYIADGYIGTYSYRQPSANNYFKLPADLITLMSSKISWSMQIKYKNTTVSNGYWQGLFSSEYGWPSQQGLLAGSGILRFDLIISGNFLRYKDYTPDLNWHTFTITKDGTIKVYNDTDLAYTSPATVYFNTGNWVYIGQINSYGDFYAGQLSLDRLVITDTVSNGVEINITPTPVPIKYTSDFIYSIESPE